MISTAVIDVGSNSVRMLFNGKKQNTVTQLSENLFFTKNLSYEAMQRTASAILNYVNIAQNQGANDIKIFATEAVRSAENKNDFVKMMRKHNIDLHVIPSSEEAVIGFMGAYNGVYCGVLDIGGASSELAIGCDKKLDFSCSLPIGAVRLKDFFNKNGLIATQDYIKEKVTEYGNFPGFDSLISIGGTSSSLVSILCKMSIYDSEKVHNFVLKKEDVFNISMLILETPLSERQNIVGLSIKKAEVVPLGGLLLHEILDYLGKDEVLVSEKDNLEGYLMKYCK